MFLGIGVECGSREVGERDRVAGRFNLVYLTGNFYFFFFNLEINQRGNLTAESRVVVVQSPSHVQLFVTPWTVALREAEWPAAKVKTHRLRIRAQAIQGLSEQFGHP